MVQKNKKVDKIVGPGNIFVSNAKKVFGEIGIDMIADLLKLQF